MIVRIVEYIIQCDGPDCSESVAYGSPARRGGAPEAKQHCADSARRDGWKEAGSGLWLCPACVRRAEKGSRKPTDWKRLLADWKVNRRDPAAPLPDGEAPF